MIATPRCVTMPLCCPRGRAGWLRAALACLLMLVALPAPADNSRLEVTTLGERAEIGKWLDLFADTDKSLSASHLLEDNDAGITPIHWQRNTENSITIGLSNQVWWLRLQVHNAADGSFRVLQLNRATLGSVMLYSKDEQGQWRLRESGALALTPRGDVDAPGYAFKVWLPSGDSTHLIRLTSSYALRTPILLSTENATLRQAQNSAGWLGWALGLLTMLLLAPLLTRQRHQVSARLALAFALIQLTAILYVMADRGVLGAWWIALPGVQHGMLQLSIMLQQLAYVWFTLTFLSEHKALSRRWHSILLGLMGLQATALMLSVVINRHETVAILALLPIVTAALITAAAWRPGRIQAPGCRLLFGSNAFLLLSRLLLAISLTPLMTWSIEPYQWLLGFHVIHGVVLLIAMQQTSRPVITQAADHVPPSGQPPSEPLAAIEPTRPDVSGLTLPLPLRVLVVEDNPWVQQVIVGLLRKQGIQSITAVNGLQALILLEQEKPDLVLMDCDLPELDGLSTTQVWRQREREQGLRPLPILAVTAHVSPAQRQQALDAGMDDFLTKPVDMRTLRDTLIYWTRVVPERRQPAQGKDSGPDKST